MENLEKTKLTKNQTSSKKLDKIFKNSKIWNTSQYKFQGFCSSYNFRSSDKNISKERKEDWNDVWKKITFQKNIQTK